MEPREQLEAALRATFSHDDLAVYADLLLAAGDPRGELIALELDPQPTPAWHARRRATYASWLGTGLAGPAMLRMRFGFLETAADEEGLALLASPAGDYLTVFEVSGETRSVRAALAKLAALPRPWLRRLAIELRSDEGIGAVLVDELIVRTPALRVLELSGNRVAGALLHPGVRELRVSGATALDWSRAPMNVESLDLAFLPKHADGDLPMQHTGFLAAAQLPALRRLDLSRNEGGARGPHLLGGTLSSIDVLAASPLVAHVRELALPSLDNPGKLRALIAAMPAIERVRIARLYARIGDQLAAISPIIELPPVFPWPPRDTLDPRDALSIAVPDEPTREVDLHGIVVYLEQAYAGMAEGPRRAWDELWGLLDELPWDVTEPFPFAVLELALSVLPDDFEDAVHWANLRFTLVAARRHRDLDDDAQVQIQRYWGWLGQ